MRTAYLPLILLVASLGCAKEEDVSMLPVVEDASEPVADAGSPLDEAAVEEDASQPDTDATLTTIVVGDLQFQARVAGPESGEPVILLHGFPQTSRAWRAQIAELAREGYRVVAPDQRGYSPGARPVDVSGYKMVALYQDVLAIAGALQIDRFHLVGHDWGGSVGWVVAAFAPQRLLSFTAISSPHLDGFAKLRMDPSSCQAAASSYMAQFIASDAEMTLLGSDAAGLRKIYDALSASDRDAYVGLFSDEALLRAGLNWYRANLGPDSMRSAIGQIRVPTLQIWSDGDIAICRDTAELTHEYVDASYRFEVIEGAAHWVPELASARVSELLRAHFAANASPSPP
jgi:pimeloyl-ACP methyl ester carboxylesterase